MRYVALLRGINVGGNNKVSMSELRSVFESAGMGDVRTYINSGNVLFATDAQNPAALVTTLEAAIEMRFGFPVRLIVRDLEQMRMLAEAIPAHWANDAAQRCDIVFLTPDADVAALMASLDPRPEVEDVLVLPDAVVWRVDRENARRSRLLRLLGTPFYQQATMRNCNTVRRLVGLLEE